MTTPAAAALYLAQHLVSLEGKGFAVYNPEGKPLAELPVIYGFNNGGSRNWLQAIAIAEDGAFLGAHICSDEGYMPHDLGILEGSRPDRHEAEYRRHYPHGYRMEFVTSAEYPTHTGVLAAVEKANAIPKAAAAALEKDGGAK
jgi:hypothetical protein